MMRLHHLIFDNANGHKQVTLKSHRLMPTITRLCLGGYIPFRETPDEGLKINLTEAINIFFNAMMTNSSILWDGQPKLITIDTMSHHGHTVKTQISVEDASELDCIRQTYETLPERFNADDIVTAWMNAIAIAARQPAISKEEAKTVRYEDLYSMADLMMNEGLTFEEIMDLAA